MVTVLGIDIGGTGSRARLCADGEVVAESEAGSASLPAAGPEGAAAALDELLAGLPLRGAPPLDAVCAGTAGLSVPGAAGFLLARLAPLALPGAVDVVSDAMLVLPAAGLDDGVAVVCGTGSVAVGACRGETVQAGGWGYLLGDEGGGYWMVREALRVLLARQDRGLPIGDLGERLLAASGADSLAELRRRYYQHPHRPREWARHAGLLADGVDPAAGDIVTRAADAAAALAVTAAGRLRAVTTGYPRPVPSDPTRLPVVLAGGGEFRVLAAPPVAGAVRLASQAAGGADKRGGGAA